MESGILLYDYKRDQNLKPGEAILVFEDGRTKRVTEKSLYGKEIVDVRQPINPKRTRAIRSRLTRSIKHRNKHIKVTTARKRTAVYKA